MEGPIKKILMIGAAGTLAIAACGGDDDSGDPADRIVAFFVDAAEQDGATADEGCLRANLVGLPESDLEAVADFLESDSDEPPTGLSEETDLAFVDVMGCLDFGG